MRKKSLPSLLTFSSFIILLSCEKTQLNSTKISVINTENQLSSIDTSFITKNLVAYFPFNKNLHDSSGNGHNGTSFGQISYVDDHAGNTKSALKLGNGEVVTDNFF